jgi:hypothetical protein
MEGWIMSDIRTSALGGIPYGDTANRPTGVSGQPYFNGEIGRLELYTSATGWQNIVQETPGVSSASGYYNESQNSGTFVISGTNFTSGAIAYAIGTDGVERNASSTVYNSIVQLTATFTNLPSAHEPYDIKITNPSNLFGILPDAFYINQTPIWSSTAGSLGSAEEGTTISIPLSASDPELSGLSYSVSSGSLPAGITLNSSTGLLSGTLSDVISDTTSTFTVSASDGSNAATRTFSYTTINIPSPSAIEALVVAGGGGGGGDVGAGGGAGGILYHSNFSVTTGSAYTVTVGLGGNPGSQVTGENGTAGEDSYFGVLKAFGGGRGGFWMNGNGFNGGSGGGASNSYTASGGTSTQTSNNGGIGYGNSGGGSNAASYASGGGGGAGAAGSANSGTQGGAGGAGLNTWSSWATATSSGDSGYFAGGGGGGGGTDGGSDTPGLGGIGGGGRGWKRAPGTATSGMPNTGGGGGGTGGGGSTGGAGGSGIVIIRYPSNYKDAVSVTNGTRYVSGGYKYYKFNASGSITF